MLTGFFHASLPELSCNGVEYPREGRSYDMTIWWSKEKDDNKWKELERWLNHERITFIVWTKELPSCGRSRMRYQVKVSGVWWNAWGYLQTKNETMENVFIGMEKDIGITMENDVAQATLKEKLDAIAFGQNLAWFNLGFLGPTWGQFGSTYDQLGLTGFHCCTSPFLSGKHYCARLALLYQLVSNF